MFTFSTVLVAVIRRKPYSGITLENGTHIKTVKITLNIFAVYLESFGYKKQSFSYLGSKIIDIRN